MGVKFSQKEVAASHIDIFLDVQHLASYRLYVADIASTVPIFSSPVTHRSGTIIYADCNSTVDIAIVMLKGAFISFPTLEMYSSLRHLLPHLLLHGNVQYMVALQMFPYYIEVWFCVCCAVCFLLYLAAGPPGA